MALIKSIGILDTGLCLGHQTPGQVQLDCLRAAQLAEAMGYTRYWLSEHHDAHYAWTDPSLMIPYLGCQTSKIRLGTAALLLGLYPPLRAAETYRTLEALFPGRVDFGLCSAAPASDELRSALLGGGSQSQQELSSRFEASLAELLSYLRNDHPANSIFRAGATPLMPPGEAAWVMGTGFGSATAAARQGLPFSYSLFHRFSSRDPRVLEHYRSHFSEKRGHPEPWANLAVSVICGRSEAEALAQKNWVESMQSDFAINVWGDAAGCALQLQDLADRYEVEEIIVFMMWHQFDRRLESIRLLASEFLLPTTAAGRKQAMEPAG